MGLTFTSQRGAQIENILVLLHEQKKQNQKTTKTNAKVRSLKHVSLQKQKLNLNFKGGRDN